MLSKGDARLQNIRSQRLDRSPKRVERITRSWYSGLDNAALEPDDRGVGSIVGAQLGQDILHAPLNSLFGNGEMDRDLFVGISGCNQTEHIDFGRCQRFVRGMFRNL